MLLRFLEKNTAVTLFMSEYPYTNLSKKTKIKVKTIAMLFLQDEEGEEAILWSTFYFLFLSNSCPFIKRLSLLP